MCDLCFGVETHFLRFRQGDGGGAEHPTRHPNLARPRPSLTVQWPISLNDTQSQFPCLISTLGILRQR